MAGQGPVSRSTEHLKRVLDRHRIGTVLDVGANTGQYAQRLRRAGYAGRIVSFEPLTFAHTSLSAAAADDPLWEVAPRMALGDRDGQVTLNVSAESDMSSALAFTEEMQGLLDDSGFVGTEDAELARLDTVFDRFVRGDDPVLLKVDTQGTERQVVEGAGTAFDRVTLLQLEMAIVPVYQGEPSYLDTIAWLAGRGFHPMLFVPGYFNRRTARLIGMDGVFARPPGQ